MASKHTGHIHENIQQKSVKAFHTSVMAFAQVQQSYHKKKQLEAVAINFYRKTCLSNLQKTCILIIFIHHKW